MERRPDGLEAMKHAVVTGDLDQDQIRPPSLFSELRQLSIEDAAAWFADAALLVDVACPACGEERHDAAFAKHGFQYRRCPSCASVFVSPRPSAAALTDYYAHSRASRFRIERFAAETAAARRFHILREHANWLGRLFDEAGNAAAPVYADVESSYPLVLEEVRRLTLFTTLYSLRPHAAAAAASAATGAVVAKQPVAGVGAMTAFEVLEHQFSPRDFLAAAAAQLAPGGLLFFTTRTISGFDLQVLWDRAPYIYVPEHLNLLSVEGLTILLERAGFALVELSTPGQLDVELVLGALRDDPGIPLPGFIATLLQQRDRRTHADFQSFLQKHRLSSHVRVAATVKQEGSP